MQIEEEKREKGGGVSLLVPADHPAYVGQGDEGLPVRWGDCHPVRIHGIKKVLDIFEDNSFNQQNMMLGSNLKFLSNLLSSVANLDPDGPDLTLEK